jgi:putative FmdB family regulatory protein
MPFYEYQCPHCGYDDEVLQKITDKPLTKCPACGKKGLKKLMSAPVFRLKGSGWYETDFKGDKENKRNLAGADKEEPKAEAKAQTKDDTKAQTKDDTKPDTPKADKSEASKPVEKASKSASKPAAKRAKAKSRPARKARR